MDPAASEALKQAQATIAVLQTYIGALAGTIALMGAFFGYKWVSAMVDYTKASVLLATSNDKLADSVKAMSEALRERG